MKTRVLLVKEVRNRFSDLFGVPEKRVTAKFVGRERERVQEARPTMETVLL